MNVRCTICDAVLSGAPAARPCPECGARSEFQISTLESPRAARSFGVPSVSRAEWEFSPDGPVLRRRGS